MRPTDGSPSAGRRSPLIRLVDFIGSINFGVTMLVLILVYSWIGSAGLQPFYPWFVRQSLEKTELQWFMWWPFSTMVALLCLSLVLITIRRIPLRWHTAGVWMVHAGVIVLVLGCWIYFGRKLEGDVAIYRRSAVIQYGQGEPVTMVLHPDAHTTLRAGDREYHIRVADLNSKYVLRTGEHEGETTYAVQLFIQPMENGSPQQAFIRQLLVGYPQYTEDVLPGQGRAVKVLGRPLVDENLSVRLDYAPIDRMYLRETAALYVRTSGSEDWAELPIRNLPRYKEYVASRDQVWPPYDGHDLPLRPLDIPLPRAEGVAGLADVSFRVTGFLPYARLESRWIPGGPQLNPYLRYRLSAGGTVHTGELLAFAPQQNQRSTEGFDIDFRWIENQAELDSLVTPRKPRLLVRVADAQVEREIPLSELSQGEEVPIGETPYRIRFLRLFPRWTLASDPHARQPASVALVQVTSGERKFTRAVVWPRADMSQDLDEQGTRHADLLDRNIHLELVDPVAPGLTFVAGPVGLHVVMVSLSGEVVHEPAEVGRPVSLLGGQVQVTVDRLYENARREIRPAIIPVAERDLKAGAAFSLIQLEMSQHGWTQRLWLPYSAYPYPTRFGYRPLPATLADGTEVELVYSRQSHRLPAAIALERFELETYPGQTRERDYISLVRFYENGKWSDLFEIRSNQPAEHAGWWYFQSTWDPPEDNYAGMNFTGLGVGNRHGVGIMLLGSIMTIVGTIWAFYVSPLIIRHQRRSGAGRPPDVGPPARRADDAAAARRSKQVLVGTAEAGS